MLAEHAILAFLAHPAYAILLLRDVVLEMFFFDSIRASNTHAKDYTVSLFREHFKDWLVKVGR